MDRKRKWDQPGAAEGDESPSKVPKVDDGKSATDAAAAAAAIAAKIAAQFAGGGSTTIAGGTFPATGLGDKKDPHDTEYTRDIEINDVRNRYMLTKGATQQQIHQETGASVTTKGIWYPDKSKATERDPPLYLHVSATTEEILQKAVAKVEELINTDMGPLTEERRRPGEPRERRKWPDEKIFVNLDTLRNFNVRAKVVGPAGVFVKHIQSETGTRVQIKGQGSGFFDSETGKESDEPMHIHITGPEENQVDRAKILTEDLLEVVRAEHTKAQQVLYQQQMELHQAQMGGYGGYQYGQQGYAPPPSDAPPPPPDAPPPPPPEDGAAPPPPPDGAPPAGPGGPSPQTSYDAFAQYWAAYGYDVQSEEFKQWMASQQAQYAQAYAAPNATQPTEAPPPPPSEAPPPAPPA